MTNPGFDITELVPTKWKAWVAAFSTFLGFAVPYLLTVATSLPQPWPAVIGVAITALSWFGVYKAPFKPTSTDAVLVHPSQVVVPTPPTPAGDYQNPWRQP